MRYNGSMVRQRVVVHGRVQGVFFRDTCCQQAATHDVAGWVRNNSDGTVEAVFEGDSAAVEAMTAWCRDGPPYALVDHLDVAQEQPAGARGFEVR